jgi:hypothetical protein
MVTTLHCAVYKYPVLMFKTSVVEPHWFKADLDLDPAFQVNSDLDQKW